MPNVPAGARKPADRKKPTAAQRRKAEEAAGKWCSVEVNGHTVRFSHPGSWRADVMEALEMGRINAWGKGVVHPDDFEEFRAANLNAFDLGPIMPVVHEFFGADQGE